MLKNIFLKTLRDSRFSLFFWSVGLVLLAVTYMSFYPSIKESGLDINQYLDKMPDAIKAMMGDSDYNTPTGYLNTEFFSILGPILFMVYAIGAGSNAIAGEEEKGTLDVLLAYPVSRSRVLLHKVAAIFIMVITLSLVFFVALSIGTDMLEMNLSSGLLAATVASLGLLTMFFVMFALMLGALTGNRGLSVGLTAVLAVGSYVLDTFGKVVKDLEPWRVMSPFFYYNDNNPLANGLDIGHVMILSAGILICLVISLISFSRRDLNI